MVAARRCGRLVEDKITRSAKFSYTYIQKHRAKCLMLLFLQINWYKSFCEDLLFMKNM